MDKLTETGMMDMKCNESVFIEQSDNCLPFQITRVPGGWLYSFKEFYNMVSVHSVFVPEPNHERKVL